MIYAHLALLSHLVFIPGFYDGHAPVKLLFVLLLATYALIDSPLNYRHLPLFRPIVAFLGVSLLSLGNVINWSLYIESMGLHVAGFVLFWVIASAKPNAKQINGIAITAFWVLIVMWTSEVVVPEEKGVMGNLSYTAIAVAQLIWFISFACLHRIRLWLAAPLFICLMSIVMFKSDAAILATVVVGGIGAICIYSKKDLNLLFAAFPAVMVITTMLLIIGAPWIYSKVAHRVVIWKNTIVMTDGLFGIGAGQFEIRYPAYANAIVRDTEMEVLLDYAHDKATGGLPTRRQIVQHSHNEYLLLLAEFGLFGMVVYCLLLSLILYSRAVHDYLSIGLGLSLIATLILSVFWFPLTHPSMAASFWVMAGLYVGYQKT